MPGHEFLALHHRTPGFVLPNAWDAGSARLLEAAGFEAIATTSAGISFAAGQADGTLTRDEMLSAVERIVGAVDVPVSADMEAGYGATPADVSDSIRLAVGAGVVGVNIEDAIAGLQLDPEMAAERIAAARSVAPSHDLVINARIDSVMLRGASVDTVADAVTRAARYITAGADCIFLPGLNDLDLLRSACAQIDAPINSVVGLGTPIHDAATLFAAGVTRITVGGSLARAALGVVVAAATAMRDHGTFDFARGAVPHATLQAQFAPHFE